jgi:hypothetical protein
MIKFSEVMQRVKTVLSTKLQKEKVLDKDVALALQIDPQYYAVMKKRNKVPYESIAYFSKSHTLNMNWVLLAQKPQYLV